MPDNPERRADDPEHDMPGKPSLQKPAKPTGRIEFGLAVVKTSECGPQLHRCRRLAPQHRAVTFLKAGPGYPLILVGAPHNRTILMRR